MTSTPSSESLTASRPNVTGSVKLTTATTCSEEWSDLISLAVLRHLVIRSHAMAVSTIDQITR